MAEEEDEEEMEEEDGPGRPKASKFWKNLTIVLLIILILLPLLATIREPEVDVTGLELRSSGGDIDIYFHVTVHNPNIVGARIDSIEGKAYVNGDYAGDFFRTEGVDIGAMGVTEFDVQFELKGSFTYNVIGTNKVRAVGTIVVDGALIDWEVRFDETRTV